MKSFLFFLLMISPSLNPILSLPNLLEKAKNNPREGAELCKKFEEFNRITNKRVNKNKMHLFYKVHIYTLF